jgi:proline dehydrogenase
MSIKSRHQLDNTRKKLQILEEEYRSVESSAQDNTLARELTIRSLKKLINQMKEEIARFESRVSVRSNAP